MKFEDSRNQMGIILSAALDSFDDDFVGLVKNPCGAMRAFRDTVTNSDSPILFKNYVASMVRNLRGLLGHPRVSEKSRFQLQRCIELAGSIINELEIDLAKQLSAVHLQPNTEPLPKDGRTLDPKTLAIARAIIEVLTNYHLFQEEHFSKIDWVSLNHPTPGCDEWKPRSETFLRQLPIDGDSSVFRVGGYSGNVLMQWSDVLDSYSVNDLDWFNDEYVLPADASWLVFFFHHDVLTIGKRKVYQ